MSSPKVSVIIPNYNHDRYLRSRIESVLAQTYKNFEILILDDCSTDNSQAIINEYRGNPVVTKVIFNGTNSGSPFKQWEKGILQARAEWIWIAESDDYADQHFLERMIGAIQPYTNIGLVYCDSHVVNDDDTVLKETFATFKNRRFNTSRWSINHHSKGIDEIENFLLPGGTINNSSAVLFNREILVRANPFDMELRYIGDKYAFLKVLALSDCVYVKDALNYFRSPFNRKHANKIVFYFYEQFLVFDWAYRSLKELDQKRLLDGFYANTRNSLFRKWDTSKLKLYLGLMRVNPYLFRKNLVYNFSEAVDSGLKWSKHKLANLVIQKTWL